MNVLVSDTSVLVDLERGALLEASFRLPFRFTVPDLLYERELKDWRCRTDSSRAYSRRVGW